MNWLKTKMGSQGWDLTDDDIKKPNVLFLGSIQYATQELEDFEEYFAVKVQYAMQLGCGMGHRICYRTIDQYLIK